MVGAVALMEMELELMAALVVVAVDVGSGVPTNLGRLVM